MIPSAASRRTPYTLNTRIYRRRNVIERLFCRLKNWCRIATRYGRHASNYLTGMALTATVAEWLKRVPNLGAPTEQHNEGGKPA